MDDESNELELQRVLSHPDKEKVQAVWARYHEMRQVVRQDKEIHFSVDVSAGVAAAIREESSTLDSGSEHRDTSAFIDSDHREAFKVGQSIQLVNETGRATQSKLNSRAWLGLAASIAFVFALILPGTDTQRQEGVATVATEAQPDEVFVKVAANIEEPKVIVEMTEEQAQHFAQYLLRHAEHSVRGTQSGFMPLARVASVNSVGI
jgi:sigma-E factor negative regulatory protein RseA